MTTVTQIRVERRSKLPSQRLGNNGLPMMSYAYKILDPEVLEKIKEEAGIDEISGLYTPTGTTDTLIFSRSRLGQLNKPVSVDFRINQTEDGRHFINIVDNSGDEILNVAAQVEQVALVSQRTADAMAGAVAQGLYGMRIVKPTTATPVTRKVATGAGQDQSGMAGATAGGDDTTGEGEGSEE